MRIVGDNGGPFNNLQNTDFPGLATLQREDRALNDGDSYFVAGAGQLAATTGAYRFLFIVGSKAAHLSTFFFRLEKGNVNINFYEAPTTSANGTALSVKNRNRLKQATKVNQTLAFHTPTYSALGEVLIPIQVPKTGSGANVSPALAGSEGWILKPNTKYIFELLNIDNSTCNFSGVFEWSEFDPALI